MTARDALTRLARGEPVGLLPTCRLSVGHADHYGEEEIVAAFREQPFDLADATWAEGVHAIAAIGDTRAIFADLADGRVARLWSIGDFASRPRPPGIAVAFDPDLTQVRKSATLDQRDFPHVAADAIALVADARLQVEGGWTPNATIDRRTRALAIRVIVTDDAVVSLFAVVRGWAGEQPSPFGHALTVTQRPGGIARVTRDANGGSGPWGWSAPSAANGCVQRS